MARKPMTVQRRRRSRRRFNTVCTILLIGCTISIAYAVAQILPDYGRWLYARHRETLDLGPVQCPSYVAVDIGYQDSPPTDIQLELDGKWVRGVNVYDRVQEHTMRVAVDLPQEYDGQSVTVTLSPAANEKLTYDLQVLSSYEYVTRDVQVMTDENGHKWLTVKAGYDNLRDGGLLRITAYFEGMDYKPTVYSFQTENNTADVCVDLTKVTCVRSLREEDSDTLTVYVGADGIDADKNPIHASEQLTFKLKEFPTYDPKITCPTDQTWTDKYLDAVKPRWRETNPEWAGQQPDTEGTESDATSPDNTE